MLRQQLRPTPTDTRFPYTTLSRSVRNVSHPRLTHRLTALSLPKLRYTYTSLAPSPRRQASAVLWRKGLVALERADTKIYIAISRQRVEESGAAVVRRL